MKSDDDKFSLLDGIVFVSIFLFVVMLALAGYYAYLDNTVGAWRYLICSFVSLVVGALFDWWNDWKLFGKIFGF